MYHVKEPLLILISIVIFSGVAAGMVVEIASYPSQATVGGWANISVRVLDNSIPQNNTPVNFTATLGNLSAASAYTNSSGTAMIWINSTATGIATINASVVDAYNTTNVTFLAGKPASIDINATQNLLVVDNTTIVNLTAYDQYNNINSTVNLTINILISDIPGKIKHDVPITRSPYTLTELAANQSNVNLTNSTQENSSVLLSINSTIAGNVTITAYAENTTGIFNITYTPAALSSISYNPYLEITVNKTLEITVNAWDKYDNPLNGTVVLFNATPPPATQYNSPIDYNSLNLSTQTITTNLNGYASTVFRVDKRAGDNIINMTVENINASVTVIGLADEASTLYLTQTPDSVYANNKDAYRLKAQVVDKFLNPVLPGGAPITDQVLFTTISSSTLVPMNASGIAVTLVGPTAYIETKMITAIYKNVTGYTNITNSTNLSFAAGNLSRFIIYANPDAVLSQDLNGNHVSTITVTSLDEWGHAIPGINITLNNTNITLGNLTAAGINATNLINTSTDSNGYRQAVFTSKIPAGNATINVSSGSINASAVVNVRDQPFLSINITFEPDNITSGQTVNMTTIISVEGELPISRPAASAMLVLDRSGSMDPDYYAGTPLDVALVLDRSGSMKFLNSSPEQPMTDAKTAAKAFMDNLVSNSQVGVVSFSTSSRVDRELTLLNSYDNKTLVRSAINVIFADGSTAMGDGMADANDMLVNGRADARKIMIVLTDGVCNTGSDCDGSDAIAFANANGITIYTIGLGSADYLDEPRLQNIAVSTGGKYYNAPTSSELSNVYNSIAQEISDYDVTQIEYGVEGFTPYNYEKQGSVNVVTIFEDSFLINETINDIKVQLDWINVSSDLNLTLISPGGHVYGAGNDTVGYYYNDGSTVLMNTTEYIWIHPLFYTYPDNDLDTVEYGNWTVRVSGNRTEKFNISTYIDKKSAVKLGSYIFISSFDASRGDRAGLVLYSYPNINTSNSQSSYLLNGTQWVGYFTGNTNSSISTSPWNITSPNYPGNYPNNNDTTWTKTVAGVSQIRVHFTKIDVEANYDFVYIYDGNGNLITIYTNTGSWPGNALTNVSSPWINGDTIKVRFTSDSSVPGRYKGIDYSLSGFQADEVEAMTITNTTFNLIWNNAIDNLDLYLYKGATLVNSSNRTSGFEELRAPLYSGYNYHVEVEGVNLSSETNFTLTASQNLEWTQWFGNIAASLNDSASSFDLLNNSIDTMKADGLTAIDEGLYQANNQFSSVSGNSTIVLMTDGLDNAGYHSMLVEAERARQNHTVIYTIGFGKNESEVDPVLSEIANITGGKYYFAPDADTLKSIFRGIAANLTNFTAEGPTLNLHLPHNYINGLSLATATYVTNSSNSTTGDATYFTAPESPQKGNAEPNITYDGNISILTWKLPNLMPGDKWGVWYQLIVQGAGYVPLILPSSNITYTDMNGTFINVNITNPGGVNTGGTGADVNYIALGGVQLSANPPVVLIGEPSRITLTATYDDGNPAIANATLYSNLGYFNISQNPLDNLAVSGSNFVNFTSATAGQARINAIASNGNNSVLGSVMVVVRPKGRITVT